MGKERRSRVERLLSSVPVWTSAAAGLVLAVASPADLGAAEEQHGPHVHGIGQLNLALDGEELEIELIAPGVDIVGFEHEAKSAEDKKAIEAAADRLRDAERLFAIPAAADCHLEEAEVESGLIEEEHEHESEHDHEEEHDHAEEHDHEEEHDHAEEHEESHAEFHAHYHFHCDDPDSLKHLDVKFFEVFPSAELLHVQMVSPNGQSATELTAEDARLTF